jgi:GTPase SAR1 family protein/Leucine-rich repeat (LRR) protein
MTDPRLQEVQARIVRCKQAGGGELDLQSMDLSDPEFAARVFAHIAEQATKLHTLNLWYTQVGDLGLAALAQLAAHLTNLRTLVLGDTHVGDTGLAALVEQAAHLTNLKTLVLGDTQVGDAGLSALAEQAVHLTNLKTLVLGDTQIGDAGLSALAEQAGHLTNLQRLDLGRTQVGDGGLSALAEQVAHLTNLQTLYLTATHVADAGLIALAEQAAHLTNLQTLGLGGTQVSDAGLIALAGEAAHLMNLRTLDLWYTQVGDAGVSALADQLVHLRNLQTLGLGYTQVGDAGLAALADEAAHLTNLQTLDLGGTQVGDAGLAALADDVAHLTNLQTLDLAGTQVGDAGLAALAEQAAHLTNLQSLVLTGTQVKSIAPEVLITENPRQIFDVILKGLEVAEAKIVVLGEPNVGKSWLCQRFFQDQVPTGRREATHDFELIVPAWKPRIGNLNVTLRVWDFGGQHILHGAHEMFLTQRSVCLLVLDVTQVLERDPAVNDPERDGNRLSYWLKMIRHFLGPDASVILVVTKCDADQTHHKVGHIDVDRLRIEHGFTTPIQLVDGFSATGKAEQYEEKIKTLQNAIQQALEQKEDLHARVSRKFIEVKKRVEREVEGRALVSLEEYRRWCVAEGVSEEQEQEVHLRTLHHFGSVFYFGMLPFEEERRQCDSSDDLPPGQRRLLKAEREAILQQWIINSHWLKWPLYEVIRKLDQTISQSKDHNQPWLGEGETDKAISTMQVDFKAHPAGAGVVRAMLKLNQLCLYDERRGKYFFPRGLRRSPDPAWTEYDAHQVKWEWGFFPEAAIHRFLVEANERNEVYENHQWRTGAVLRRGKATASLEARPESGEVTVRFKKVSAKADPRDPDVKLLNHIRDRLEYFIGRESDQETRSWESRIPVSKPDEQAEPKRKPTQPAGEPINNRNDFMEQLAQAVGGPEGKKILQIANDNELSADEKMRRIFDVDRRCVAWKSPEWSRLLGVTPDAVRQTSWWKEDRKQYFNKE